MKQILISSLAVLALSLPAFAQQQNQQQGQAAINVPGVDQLYALQSDNSLLAYATPEGYQNLRSLVRHIAGQLDIIRTDVAYVELSPARLSTLNLPGTDSGKLLAAFAAGRLPITDRVHLTTREDTPIDTLLHTSAQSTIALSLVPREGNDGTLSTEFLQPSVVPDGVAGGSTIVARLSPSADGTVRLLFITPSLVPSASRRTH